VTAAIEAGEARAIFTDLGDGWGLVMASVAAGVAARCAGRTDEAIDLLTDAVETARTGRYAAVGLLATGILGYAYLDANDTAAAERAVTEAVTIGSGLDLEAHAVLGVEVLRAQLLRARGDLEDALKILDHVDSEAGAPSLLFPRRQALAHHAGALLDLGRVDEAADMVDRALECAGEDIRSSVVTMRVLAAVRTAQGRADDAAEAIAAAYELASTSGYRTEVALTERTAGRLGIALRS
jgi:tetratricopeptide (TPR) repeat protein